MDAAFANAKDDLLGAIDHLIDFLAFIIGQFSNLARGSDQATEDSRAFNNAGIVIDIERSGGAGNQVREIGRPTDLFEPFPPFQLIDNGDKVEGFAPFVKRAHGFV